MDERRKFFRFGSPLNVKYTSERDKRRGTSLAKNISREGMAFSTNRRLTKEDILKMELEMPADNAPALAYGTVEWVKQNRKKKRKSFFDVGVKFISISNFDRGRILDYAYKEWLKSLKDKGVI